MTEFYPKKQTPEEVAEGLRNAFKQAMKDGVMDATPYLKQMTFNTDIEKTEAEIKVLQKKLELLKWSLILVESLRLSLIIMRIIIVLSFLVSFLGIREKRNLMVIS
jgi:hypothetical protein